MIFSDKRLTVWCLNVWNLQCANYYNALQGSTEIRAKLQAPTCSQWRALPLCGPVRLFDLHCATSWRRDEQSLAPPKIATLLAIHAAGGSVAA